MTNPFSSSDYREIQFENDINPILDAMMNATGYVNTTVTRPHPSFLNSYSGAIKRDKQETISDEMDTDRS